MLLRPGGVIFRRDEAALFCDDEDSRTKRAPAHWIHFASGRARAGMLRLTIIGIVRLRRAAFRQACWPIALRVPHIALTVCLGECGHGG